MMQNQNQEPYNGPAWSIVDVTDTQIFDREAGVLPAKRVTFKLWNGKRSYVDIPTSDFTPDTVNTKVDEAASALFEVMALTGAMITIIPQQQM